MGKNSKKQTVNTSTTAPDASAQAYIEEMRKRALAGADAVSEAPGSLFTGEITPEQIQQAMSPYTANVVDATRGEYDRLRAQAMTGTSQQATQAGAYGGSRAAVLAGSRLGQLDQGQASTIAQLLQGGFQNAQQFAQVQQGLRQQQMMEPVYRNQQGLNFLNLGMGPVGAVNSATTSETGNRGFGASDAAGLALTGLGIYQQLKGRPAANGMAMAPGTMNLRPGLFG